MLRRTPNRASHYQHILVPITLRYEDRIENARMVYIINYLVSQVPRILIQCFIQQKSSHDET